MEEDFRTRYNWLKHDSPSEYSKMNQSFYTPKKSTSLLKFPQQETEHLDEWTAELSLMFLPWLSLQFKTLVPKLPILLILN